MGDLVNHPSHYTQASVPLEPIDVLRHAPFTLGNCLKYIIRAGHKGDALTDWKKARKYFRWAVRDCSYVEAPYVSFFCHHIFYLRKFKVFEELEEGSIGLFYDQLGLLIEKNIQRLEAKE